MEFRIEPGSRQAIYRQLSEQIREAIATGRLAEGEKLPSVRELSRTLVVNPNTFSMGTRRGEDRLRGCNHIVSVSEISNHAIVGLGDTEPLEHK